LTLGGLLITLGIIYGDWNLSIIRKAILGNNIINADIVLGISCVFWTTLQTVPLSADNHGEGGFSLYMLWSKKKIKWLIVPAIIGGSASLTESLLSISVSSAVEGIRTITLT
jgi:KUP system potassium uptake protein